MMINQIHKKMFKRINKVDNINPKSILDLGDLIYKFK